MNKKVVSSFSLRSKLAALIGSFFMLFMLACSDDGKSDGVNTGSTESEVPTDLDVSDFVTDNAELEAIRGVFILDGPLAIANIKPKLIATWNYAKTNYFETITIDTKQCTFIKDPSQGDEMVSEGTGFWLRIAALMAQIDPANAAEYQTYFDQMLNGANALIKLAQDNGNAGALPAWAFEINGGVLGLNYSQSGPANSASDADFDIAKVIILALENVSKGLWTNNSYDSWLDPINGYIADLKNVFEEVNGVIVMKPSEDWNSFKFGDYHRPADAYAIYLYFIGLGNTTEANFWKKVAEGNYLVYFENILDTANVPANENIDNGGDYIYDLFINEINPQSWDGVRGYFHVAKGLWYFIPNYRQKQVFKFYLPTWENGYTVPALDSAMALTLALAIGDLDSANTILTTFAASIDATYIYDDMIRYYQVTLRMLAILHIHTPVPQIQKTQMAEINYPRSGSKSVDKLIEMEEKIGKMLEKMREARLKRAVDKVTKQIEIERRQANYPNRWNSRQEQ